MILLSSQKLLNKQLREFYSICLSPNNPSVCINQSTVNTTSTHLSIHVTTKLCSKTTQTHNYINSDALQTILAINYAMILKQTTLDNHTSHFIN